MSNSIEWIKSAGQELLLNTQYKYGISVIQKPVQPIIVAEPMKPIDVKRNRYRSQ